MENTAVSDIDLFAGQLPSIEQITRLADSVNSAERNRINFEARLEENLSKGGSDAALAAGIGLYILGRYKEAIEKLKAGKDCKEKFMYLAFALRAMRSFDEVIDNLQKAAEHDADTFKVNLEKAVTYRLAKNFEAAAEQLKKCANFENVSADYHCRLGQLLGEQGRYEQAAQNYTKAIELDANHREALFHLAYRCDLSGDEEAAVDYYKQVITNYPVHVNALLNLAVLYEDTGQYDKALRCVNKVLKFHPNNQRAILFKKDIESSKTMYYDEEREKKRTRRNQILETPISDFELSVRSRNCLKKMNINTLGDLLNITEAELLSYKNFGETSLREIKAILDAKNLQLGMALGETQPEEQQAEPDESQEDSLLSKPIDDLQLSVRARKCLVKLNLRTLGDLTRKTEAELLGCKNFGVTSLNEIKKAMASLDLSLRSLE